MKLRNMMTGLIKVVDVEVSPSPPGMALIVPSSSISDLVQRLEM